MSLGSDPSGKGNPIRCGASCSGLGDASPSRSDSTTSPMPESSSCPCETRSLPASRDSSVFRFAPNVASVSSSVRASANSDVSANGAESTGSGLEESSSPTSAISGAGSEVAEEAGSAGLTARLGAMMTTDSDSSGSRPSISMIRVTRRSVCDRGNSRITAKLPSMPASVRDTSSPSSRTITVEPGSARPATIELPSPSTRTTSMLGGSGSSGICADASASDSGASGTSTSDAVSEGSGSEAESAVSETACSLSRDISGPNSHQASIATKANTVTINAKERFPANPVRSAMISLAVLAPPYADHIRHSGQGD